MELAKDASPKRGQAAAMRDRAALLWSVWTAGKPGGNLRLRDDLLSRFWGGSRPPARMSAPPSADAVRALARRHGALSRAVAEEERRAREEHARRERDEQRREENERRKAAEAADAVWRRELLRGE